MSVNKLLFALAGTLALGLQGALTDSVMTTEEWVTVGAALLAAFGTWLVPNTPVLATAKTWVNALVLGAGVLVPLLADGVSGHEVWTVVIAVLTAAGVYAVPNGRNRDM
jgi:positive regulator of sigma E activity